MEWKEECIKFVLYYCTNFIRKGMITPDKFLFSPTHQDCDKPSSLQNVSGDLSLGVKLTTHFYLIPRLKLCGALLPCPLHHLTTRSRLEAEIKFVFHTAIQASLQGPL